MSIEPDAARWFNTLRLRDVPLVGGKNASLGELYSELGSAGVRVPNGFALTARAYRDALTAADAWPGLHAMIADAYRQLEAEYGAGELSGDRAVPRRARHRIDQRDPLQPAAHRRRGAGSRATGQARVAADQGAFVRSACA